MNIQEPFPLYHSWPLFEAEERLAIDDLGPFTLEGLPTPGAVAAIDGMLAARGIGVWECNLNGNRLSWSAAVYDLFGVPRGAPVTRELALSRYSAESRLAMEQMRAYAIRHRRGFTIDAELIHPDGTRRWMRLSTAPVVESGKVVRLCGLKIDVTTDYAHGPRKPAIHAEAPSVETVQAEALSVSPSPSI